jgi:signal peptidase I
VSARDDVSLPGARRSGGSHRGGRRAAPVDTTRRAPRPTTRTGSSGGRRIARRPHLPIWQETGLLLVVALVLAVVVKTFFVQAFYIPSGSMEPTFQVDDRVLVQKVGYWAGDVQRGDVVVFDDPGGWLAGADEPGPSNAVQKALESIGLFPSGGHLIKRVVGVGGDRVTCCSDDGKLEVNGVALDEPYLADQVSTAEQTFDVVVPEGYLWVMGDNRGDSADSRAHQGDPGGGFLPESRVTGKAWVTVWPWSRVSTIGDARGTFDEDALDRAAPAARRAAEQAGGS